MLETLKNPRILLAFGGVFLAGSAWAFPWDIDMVDSRAFRAYEWAMLSPIPAGAVQRPAGAVERARGVGGYQNDYIAPLDRNGANVEAMVNPYEGGEKSLAQGKRLFQTTCAPCHGVEGKGGGPVTHNDPAKNIRRFQVPAPMLSGEGAVSAIRSDGYIYGTIRNGGSLMPAYGASLTDQERWSIVAYIRTLDGAAFAPPAAAATDAAAATTPAPAAAPATTKGTTP